MDAEETFNTSAFGAPQGWQCPICKRVYSPLTPMCYYCGNGSFKLDITYAEKPPIEASNQILNDLTAFIHSKQYNDTIQRYKEQINTGREAE